MWKWHCGLTAFLGRSGILSSEKGEYGNVHRVETNQIISNLKDIKVNN